MKNTNNFSYQKNKQNLDQKVNPQQNTVWEEQIYGSPVMKFWAFSEI